MISLARNSGQHNAVMAGLNYASGELLIAWTTICRPILPAQISAGRDRKGYDIVYGYYPKRNIPFPELRQVLSTTSPSASSSASRRYADIQLLGYPAFRAGLCRTVQTRRTHLQGLFLRTTRNISCIPIKHFEREVGESGYTLKKLLQLWSNIMGYSVIPLRMATYCGYFF